MAQKPVCQLWVCRLHTVAWVRPLHLQLWLVPREWATGLAEGHGQQGTRLLCEGACYLLASHSGDLFSAYDVLPLCQLGAQKRGDSRTPPGVQVVTEGSDVVCGVPQTGKQPQLPQQFHP